MCIMLKFFSQLKEKAYLCKKNDMEAQSSSNEKYFLQLNKIYKLYGYEIKNYGTVVAYEYKRGRYFGVDLFTTGDEESCADKKNMYQEQGFSVSCKKRGTVEDIDNELFNDFFQIPQFKKILQKQYSDYVHKIECRFPFDYSYQYINGKYRATLFDMDDFGGVIEDNEARSNVLETIIEKIDQYKNEPLLTIIEAAAGYGKTCTAYEIMNKLATSDRQITPLYIELARNREARIFKHILQNEIEKQFQNVGTSDLVEYQIKRGKIPVIIDGFDELLSKDFEEDTNALHRDVESMLSTILDLLEGQAKVIITSRKTAVLNGDLFYSVIEETERRFYLQRIALEAPVIEDWLRKDQIDQLKNSSFDFSNIANPVLLSYIRGIGDDEFKDIITQKTNIVEIYFKALLERERKRQALLMDEEMQKRIFRKLARIMCDFDIKSYDKPTMKELILDYNEKIFNDYIKNYPNSPKPTHDDLAETLSNHALLDRNKDNLIGFVNDFIFGILIAENIINGKFVEHYPDNYKQVLSQGFARLAIDSYKSMPSSEKEILWEKMKEHGYTYDDSFNFSKDILLTNKLHESEYANFQLEDVDLTNVTFGHASKFRMVIFSNIRFRKCSFTKSAFIDTSFVNCSFYDCEWIEEQDAETTPYIIGSDCNNDFLQLASNKQDNMIDGCKNERGELNKIILSQFVRSEGKVVRMKRINAIKSECEGFSEREIIKALNSLENSHYLVLNGGNCFIQKEGVSYYNKNLA